MALTIADIIRHINPNIGVIANLDGVTFRVGVEDVNSDEMLAALAAMGVDLAAIEVINTAIQVATEASAVDLAAIEVINTAIQAAVEGIQTEMTPRNSVTISVTKPVTAAGNYAAEDVLSESAGAGTVWTWAAIFRANNTGGYLTKATISCETTGLTHRCTLYLFNAAPTCNLNDNVANTAVLNADIAQYLGKIDFPALSDLGGNSEAVATPSTYGNLPMWVDAAVAADDLIGVLVTRDAITGESAGDDYTIKLTVDQY